VSDTISILDSLSAKNLYASVLVLIVVDVGDDELYLFAHTLSLSHTHALSLYHSLTHTHSHTHTALTLCSFAHSSTHPLTRALVLCASVTLFQEHVDCG
jgi:hypothetical protein